MKKKILNILLSIVIMSVAISVSVFAEDDAIEDIDYNSITAVTEKIDAIGDITVYSGNKIREVRAAYEELSDEQKMLIENYSILTDAEDALLNLYTEAANTNHAVIYESTIQHMEESGTPSVGSVGGEWLIIALTRSGRDCPMGYYENATQYVKENINENEQLHRAKSTDNSRVILALTSAGYDVTDVGGHNLLKGLSDMNYIKKQGINGLVWALIAFDSYNYEIPQNENEETQATREEIISYILEKQLADGGWSIWGEVADPDITGMAIQALAPYYTKNPDVEVAVEKALECLSSIQHENGSFGSVDGACSESCAQVITALTALGINPETDERFIKNGISVVDALCIYAVDGGFEHISGIGLDGMATEQGLYALASYFRFLEGKTFLYDMTDVIIYTDDSENYEDTEIYGEPEEDYYDVSNSFEVDSDSDVSEEAVLTENDKAENKESTEETEEIEKSEKTEEKEEEISENTEKIIFTSETFEDVKKDVWYYEAVEYVYKNGLMQGTGNGFEPESKMSRAMLVTVLYRMANPENTENTHSFTDVTEERWYSDAVSWAASNGIVSGISKTEFSPDSDISREQMAAIIYRFAKIQGYDVTDKSDISGFSDANDISNWAFDAICWANKVEIMNGISDTTLSPKTTANRAQVAASLMRFCKTVAK